MSELVKTHEPCPRCGSSDAAAMNSDRWWTCFSCGDRWKDKEEKTTVSVRTQKNLPLIQGEVRALGVRKIHEETAAKFGYLVGTYQGKTVQIAPYRDAKGTIVAQKIRFPDKTFTITGKMPGTLFGQHLWKDGGKRVVVTEGEIDAMSVAQVFNLSWPVVSVPNGAQGAKKSIQQNLEWLERFDQVVFMFDEDAQGQKAAVECAELLTPGKAAIASLPLKDANEMLKAGRSKELTQAVWNARTYRPDGVINASELWHEVSKPVEMGTPYPFPGLNKTLFGLRPGEIATFAAGSGIGKTAITREIAYHLGNTLEQPVGWIGLEENVGRSTRGLMGLHLSKPIWLPGVNVTEEERRRAFEETAGTGRYWLYDHFGSLDSDNLLSKLKYMVLGCGVRWLILDHISIVVSGLDAEDDERRAIDRTMTRLRQFTEQTKAGLILVSHLKRPNGAGHEEGAPTSLAQLRGSAAIAQLSDIVIGAERNQQAANETQRNTTVLRVLKNRYAGITGVAEALRWNPDTGRLSPVEFIIEEDGSVTTDPSKDFDTEEDDEESGLGDEVPF